MNKEEEFFEKLMASFREESQERAQKISNELLDLEKSTSTEISYQLIESIFREVHSLKSAARAVNRVSIEQLCSGLETAFSYWKKAKTFPSAEQFDILHKVNDAIDKLIPLSEIEIEVYKQELNTLLEYLKKTTSLSLKSLEESPPSSSFSVTTDLEKNEGSVRIASQKLDMLLVQVEELLETKIKFLQRLEDLVSIKNDLFEILKEANKLVFRKKGLKKEPDETARLEKTTTVDKKIINFLEFNEKTLKSLTKKVQDLYKQTEGDCRTFNLEVNALMENTKKLIMLPFSSLLNTFPKTVRELARDQGKDINFILEGAELEVDKRILAEIKDVLLHIIRNSIDHGIETIEDRAQKNKNKQGTLKISICHLQGNEVSIEIQDDGAGINIEKIKEAAVKQGWLTLAESKEMVDDEALMLIFQSGISTSPIVTDLSGRGLGMSIIREKIEKLSGKILVSSEPNQGTTLTIQLPLTLATFKGLLISIENQKFVIPMSNIERIIRVVPESIQTIETRETILYNGQTTSLIRLKDILGLSLLGKQEHSSKSLNVIVISGLEKKVAFVVDEVIAEQEILVKNFVAPLLKVKYTAAAAILGTGKAVPILNTLDLLHSSSMVARKEIRATALEESQKKHILLAEDSITTRLLLKNILELGGYDVTTAVDGQEAWNLLNNNSFSAVVSDIEMPHLNGFELTQKIRSGQKFQELPVILVTSLESEQDKEKGIDVGANAYIRKSTFDSNSLLGVIQRLTPE